MLNLRAKLGTGTLADPRNIEIRPALPAPVALVPDRTHYFKSYAVFTFLARSYLLQPPRSRFLVLLEQKRFPKVRELSVVDTTISGDVRLSDHTVHLQTFEAATWKESLN